ncbi:putative tRNA pseudouridine synthase [Tanacetum coccineum]
MYIADCQYKDNIEKELETAIYKAGGIRDSNFGDLNKIAWATSSQIDDEVHSLSTMISFKMEIPENAWIDDPNGISLANVVNTYLPKKIKVFSILPSQKGFNAKEECNMRKYGYLLPLEVIGITSNFTEAEVQHHLLEFNNILSFFEGKHPFHNYTIPSEYKEIEECDEEVLRTNEMVTECVDGEQISGRSIGSDKESDVNETSLDDPPIFGKWLHEPDENDRITDIHFRYIFQSSCGKVKHLFGRNYVEISICGESFMLHQICKMVGAAIAVKRGLLPRDIIPLSLNKFTRFILPIAPSEVLFLRWNHFILEKESGKSIRPEILTSVESEEILNDVDDFYESVMLPTFSEYLDPLKSPWKEWVELLDSKTKIPDSQLDEIRSAWATWEENFWIKTDAAM